MIEPDSPVVDVAANATSKKDEAAFNPNRLTG
jgi:hypothetical protein